MTITPYKKNAKKHPDSQLKQIALSLKEYGWRQPIVVDKNDEIIVGHGRWMAYEKYPEGIKEPWIVKADDLTPEQVRGYRLMDNKTNESDWDMALAIEELKELDTLGFDIELTGFDKDLLIEPDEKDDLIPENVPAKAKLGDLYQLGSHRVLCGDSTQPEAVLRLCGGNRAQMCFTDPPYNVNYTGGADVVLPGGKRGFGNRKGIQNDNMTREAFKQFLTDVMKPIVENTDGGIYICMSSSELDSLRGAFEKANGHWQSFIMWVKNNFTLSRADYQNTYEPILYGWRNGIVNHYFTQRRDIANVWEDLSKVKTEYDGKETTITFQGFKVKLKGKIESGQVIRKKQHTDIWRHDKPSRSELHPTQKPVALVIEAITNSSSQGDIVLDTFGG